MDVAIAQKVATPTDVATSLYERGENRVKRYDFSGQARSIHVQYSI